MRNLCYIDLKALEENAKKIRKLLPEKVKFNAVVKADGYGHGAEKVASTLYPIVDEYSVSIVEEGVALRNSGIDKGILTLIPPRVEELSRAIEHELTLCCDSLSLLKKINARARALNKTALVHVKYDTGMHRLGVKNLSELEKLFKESVKLKNVKITGFFSHYANALDKIALKKATDKFLLAIQLVKRYNNNVTCHISASGGFLRGEYFDMVRIGLLLYGYKPFRSNKISLSPVMKIYAYVLSRFTLMKGESALYGKRVAKKDTEVTLVRYGYADGEERNETEETLNNRCMDITAVRGNVCGKKYLLLKNANAVAKKYRTISYEILVKSAIRAEKIYLN